VSQDKNEATSTPATGGIRHEAGIDGASARDLGTNAVTQGALERAEAAVAGNSPMPRNQEQSDSLTRVYVTPDGKVSTTPPAGSAVQLTGAEADAYLKAHGGGKQAASADAAPADTAPEKATPKKANKERKGSGTKKS